MFQVILALLAKMLFEDHSIAGIRAEHGIGHITQERDKSNDEVYDDVEHHLDLQSSRQAAFNLPTSLHNHQCQKGVQSVSNTKRGLVSDLHLVKPRIMTRGLPRNNPNDTAPTKPNPKESKETHVEAVSPSLDLGQDLAIMFRDARRQSLLALLGSALARLPVQPSRGDSLKVGVLLDVSHHIHETLMVLLLTSLPNLF